MSILTVGFGQAISNLEKQKPFSVWEPGSWELGVWNESAKMRIVIREFEKHK